ncbi:MAG: hypothetical protein AAGN35_01270 [Bacteroidota bacterium]
MKHTLLILCCLLAISLPGWGQETLLSDPTPQPVFAGTISYQIAYSGKVSHEQKHFLPDSMTVAVGAPYIRIRFFGGMAEHLLHEIHWDRRDGTFLLLDHANRTALVPAHDPPQSPAKLVRPDAESDILGYSCSAYTIATAGERYRIWASDSIYFPLNVRDSVPEMRPLFFQADLPTIPLKMVRTRNGITTTTTATAISLTPQTATDLQLPDGYTRIAFESRMSRHPFAADRK